MALQVTPDLVVLITKTVRVVRRVRIQQQPRRLNRPCRHDYYFRARAVGFNFPCSLNEIRHAGHVAAVIGLNSLRYCFRYESTVAGCQRAGNHRVMRAIFGIGSAGEADAVFAGDTGVPPAVRQGVDK